MLLNRDCTVCIMGMDDWFNCSSGLAQKPMSQSDKLAQEGFNFNGFEGFFAKLLNGNNLDYIFCQTSKWQQTWLICTTSWNSHY